VISALAAPGGIHRECLSRAVTCIRDYVCVLTAVYAFCLLLPLGYVDGE